MKSYILLLFTILFTALTSLSQIKISGKVTDDKDSPIEFATIRVHGTAIGTNSNLKGEYSLTVAQRDTLIVEVSCLGYADLKRQYIKPKGNIVLNAKLYQRVQELGEVEVVEIKRQTNQMQSLDAKNLRLTPDASGGSVEAVISTMAGVSSKNEMSSQYMVRGGSYDENSVYINGIEIYRPQLISSGQQEGLSIINPDMVGAVNFSTGGFSAEYGDKMSSVLDITYREPEAFEGAVAMSLQGGSLSLGQSSKRFSQMHGFRYKRNSSLLGSLETKGEYDPQYFDYQTNLNYKIGEKWKASFLGNISINNYRFTPQNRNTSFGTSLNAKQFTVFFDGHEKDKFETYFGALSLNYRHSKNTDMSLLASGYLTNELVAYDIHGEYWLDEAGTSGEGGVGGELGVGKYHEHARNRLKMSVFSLGFKGHTVVGRNKLTYGVSFNHENVYERASEWEQRDSAGYSLPHTGNGVHMVYNLTSKQDFGSNRISSFVHDTYKHSSGAGYWTINGGVRLSYWDFNSELLISPRFSVGFIPKRNERFALRFATGLYYQSPFYKEYRMEKVDDYGNYYIDLNKDIKSQRSLHFIFGGDYTFRTNNRPFKFTTEMYYKNLSNVIPYEIDNLKLVYSGLNESGGYVVGVDFKFFGQFVEGTDSWVSFSLMKTSEKLNGVNVPRPTDQRYSFALFFTDYFPKFPKAKFSLKAIFSDGLPTTSPRTTRDVTHFRVPAYKRVDAGISYQLVGDDKGNNHKTGLLRHFKSVWIGVDVFNLFDISNVSSYYWVTDVNDMQYAVPNYLTRRQLNVRLSVNF